METLASSRSGFNAHSSSRFFYDSHPLFYDFGRCFYRRISTKIYWIYLRSWDHISCLFILIAKAFPDAMPNRVKTWESRIESFWEPSEKNDNYQVEKQRLP